MASDATNSTPALQARVVLQQCLSARLMIQPASEGKEAEYVQIERGMVVYVCFLQGATEEIISKIASSILNARLSETDTGRLVSILDLPGDVLIIPQATLGGNLKGKGMQYHRNIGKDDGLKLYTQFLEFLEGTVQNSTAKCDKNIAVKYGTYGNRQVFSMETNGPYTHYLEF
ncbi:D-aminoacyl-tRNA deacylase 2-like [Dreissena polymorpha]|uniref:D-aminoacyl-tRNA deacylase n=1 Tax=Dreissena polymorpha TaxID=45954 RepID=A0A9D4L3W6_DREPO|nr:D-aminoacyl-tRNA deacylase 2-like [Dreissena polymorpha]XP_052272860.1 D-aminoacyl-tRNA deacylase 2-like [Dreissena polymorpha]XP_052272861.1 D-aminoacyl-tRNA deacylase 2-like [Dreissena polymorpha]XP_052272862.1 D-aminoacyl-tRNA deacylase 2-like [Dreissena polymorpha]XP_052272863.1 D-aminoacyl-tRNA deacylase 2-like [Dreissena polymorpha]XP_052272864.1 D-aminoacyl-tRNA deacylase 2-like [Dreissena polymorpha]XP_052272866.1 D-aminoacyl-tRNA deacylase 2-like [Dreissena polymorpha]XP_05227286